MADEWDEFESGSYDGGYDDLSTGGDTNLDNNLDWQDTIGTEGDLAQQLLAAHGETEFNDADSHLVGMDTDAAILNARLRSTGLPITAENQIGEIPEHMKPSDVTHYDLSGLKPEQRQVDSLTVQNVMQGNISTIQTSDITSRQQRQFDKILSTAQRGGVGDIDALPAIQGHADTLTREDYSIGGKSVDQVLYNLATQYTKPDTSVMTNKLLARQLGIQIPRTSRGMQASFGGTSTVSHFDALPLPSALPSMFSESLKQTLNVSGGAYNPDYRESREYQFASKADKASMDYFNKPSPISTLTGAAYVGMHKSPAQLAKLDPTQSAALESQKDIEADFKGFLSLAGLAKDIKGRKLSSDNSQGTATNFIRPTVGAEYHGTSNLDELARHGLMEEAGYMGEGGQEGQMSSLGNYSEAIMGGMNPVDFNRPFTSRDVALAMGEDLGDKSIPDRDSYVEKDRVDEEVFLSATAKNINSSKTFDEAVAKTRTEQAPKQTAERSIGQANVEAALKARGLNISSAEQGSPEWLAARTNTLTSTGVGTSMSEPVYGDTWIGHIQNAINEKARPDVAAKRSNPMFDAGARGEELGKKWFEDKFDKNIVDLGLITDPSKPNQGTSVDGVVTGRDGTVGANLELTEFKWGTTRFPPRDAAKKHQQQLQHQMFMTGAESVNLVTGYDPESGSPRAGNEENFIFANEPVFRDPDWAKNNADFIQARANEKAGAVQGGSTEGIKESYLAALRERYPNESDKGLTKDEKAEKKRLEAEDRLEEKEFKKEQKISQASLNSTMSFLAKGAGGGINLQSSVDYLGGMGPVGKVLSGVIGVGSAAYDATRAANDLVGRAADVGAESTQGFEGSKVALKALSFNDKQAESFASSTESSQALASIGEFDPLIKRLTAYRGLVSMEELQTLSAPEQTVLLRNRADEQIAAGNMTEQQFVGSTILAGDFGTGRKGFQTDEQEKEILAKAKAREESGARGEETLRATVGTMNVEAVNLNIKDKATETLLGIPSGTKTNFDAMFNPSDKLQEARDRFSSATTDKMLNSLNPFASDKEDADVKREYEQASKMVDLANALERNPNAMVGDTVLGRNKEKITVTVDSIITDDRTETIVKTSLNDEPQPTQRIVAKEE